MNPLLNAGAVPGRIMPGYLADRFGTFNTIIITAGGGFQCAVWVLVWSGDFADTGFYWSYL
jgi:hypothetical protein